MKFNAKYEINGEKVYTISQIKEVLEYAAKCRLELSKEFMEEECPTASSLRLAAYNLSFSKFLISFAKSLDDYFLC